MAQVSRKISALIEEQLPAFVSTEYENFTKLLERYYEHLENQGNPLDIINNITKYADIDYYEENLLTQYTSLTSNVSSSDTTIYVEDTASFPEKNGYIKIDDEICFYKSKTSTSFNQVSRGVSGNVTLGDLYDSTEFVTTAAAPHENAKLVYNVSNLFLYAFVKNFESQYLNTFPEKYLKGQIDKRTIIKNIGDFYSSKGTDKSIKFIFNSLISREAEDVPEIYYPKDFTLKSSTADWITTYSLKVKVLSGTPTEIIGKKIIQSLDENRPNMLYASAIIDNVIFRGTVDGEDIYEIILDPASVNGTFEVAAKTVLKKQILASDGIGKKINVFSTLGWKENLGRILVGNEVIQFNEKSVNQFYIERRSAVTTHVVGSKVYSYSTVSCDNVNFLILGIIYNLNVKNPAPYSLNEEKIQFTPPGFETADPIITNQSTNATRWIINETNAVPNAALNPIIQSAISDIISDVSAIFEDDQYYYICSSGLPSHQFLTASETRIPSSEKILRLIRKVPTTTTEVYPTTTSDIGVFVNGTLAFGYRDEEYVSSGKITKATIIKKGTGYKKPPYVLINNLPGKASSVLAGEVLQDINIETQESFTSIPQVTVTAGRNAAVRAIVTSGKITSLQIDNQGEYYSSPPVIVITDLSGRGKFADYKAIISLDGKLIDFEKISEGKFYTQENVVVQVIEDARSTPSTVEVDIKRWIKNRIAKTKLSVDDNNGTLFETFSTRQSTAKKYIYGTVANPRRLRVGLGDNLSSTFVEPTTKTHSPILGYAYDGNPIYGPFAYSNPLDSSSSIVRMQSGYTLKSSRVDGPPISQYPLGSFIDDYEYVNTIFSSKSRLDENNGRFCITPDYPDGVYAYFITINSLNTPIFPYIIGQNYYSLPVDSNYNSPISQDNLPKESKRLRTAGIQKNGDEFVGIVDLSSNGGISDVDIQNSVDSFSVDCKLFINNQNTSGFDAAASVSSVYGKQVESIECKQTKSLKIEASENVYLFENDFIRQPITSAVGQLIGNSFNTNSFILRNVIGSFDKQSPINADINVVNILVDQNASYTVNSQVELTDSINPAAATGIILENTSNQNSLKVKVLSGTFAVDNTKFIKSNNLLDTVGSKIISVSSLSKNISINTLDDKIAIVKTSSPHNLTVGDQVSVDINPNDSTTQTTYYVRNRYYQKLILSSPSVTSQITDTGVGSFDLLNSGDAYTTNVYPNVELIFVDQTKARKNIGRTGDVKNAKATITVSTGGKVTSVSITSKGYDYKKGDILTVTDASLLRSSTTTNTQRLRLQVDHVGFSLFNTSLSVSDLTGISINDILKIGNELIRVTAITPAEKKLTVSRGISSTIPTNHYNNAEITLNSNIYRFTVGSRPLGSSSNAPFVHSYDSSKKELILRYNYTTSTPLSIVQSSSFTDSSTPAKQVKISDVYDAEYLLEFSTDNTNFVTNPVLDVQKYYKYKFDTSHSSMTGVYLNFSPSINFNIATTEKQSSDIEPGLLNSNIIFKLGFGSLSNSNSFTKKYPVKYSKYYYFAKSSIKKINSQSSYLNVIEDSLSGTKSIISTTNNRFVYKIDSFPQYDGSGNIFYTTTSKFAIGKINSISIQNFGLNYTRIPIVEGVFVATENSATLSVNYNPIEKNINSISVVSSGSNYSKPKAVVTDGNGADAVFDVVHGGGKILNVVVKNKGKNYTFAPTVKIIETDVKLFFKSTSIGIPQSVKIISNGSSFHADKSLRSDYITNYNIFVKNHDIDAFSAGEKVVQRKVLGGVVQEVFSGYVSKFGWTKGSNLLKLEKISGTIDKNLLLYGTSRQRTANITEFYFSSFSEDIRSYFDNYGTYNSEKGKLGASSQRIIDSYFYQDYSYVVKSRTAINVWRDLIKQTTHPAGFKLFGEIIIESDAVGKMSSSASFQNISHINLAPKTVSVVGTRKFVTQNIISTDSLNIERGVGSVFLNTYDNSETIAGEIILSAPFNGNFNPRTGQVEGTKIFNLLDKKTGLAITPFNAQQLIVTLDGIIQEPGLAYRVSGSTIIFDKPPFGPRVVENQSVNAQTFYCKFIKFKSNTFNSRYLRKLKSIDSLFDGVTSSFDLYYDNGSIVKTESNENLIVTLNGVLQKAKREKDIPFGNSYYILRSPNPLITDKIIFSSAPINHEDLYTSPEKEIDGSEKSFIYSVGNYTRLTIPKKLIKFKGGGPFLLIDEVTKKVVNVDDPKYVLVFVDGVLQREIESYVITGSLITFTNRLNYSILPTGEETTADVSILLLYGRELEKTITLNDFETSCYYNITELTISGSGSYNSFKSYYGKKSNGPVWVYQDNNIFGKILYDEKISASDWKLTITSNNNIAYNSSIPLKFSSNSNLKLPEEFSLSGISVLISFERDADGSRVLSRETNRYYYRSSLQDRIWNETKRLVANILPGDKIKIDGENDYRQIKSIPSKVKSKQFNINQQVSSEIYAKIGVSNYNDIIRGEGLSVTTRVKNGKVTELIWNKRELDLYFKNGTLLQPTAYQYYTNPILQFVPENESGGGAKGEVIIYDGQVIDVVLISGGSGYTQPPKVFVARGYDIIKENRKIDSVVLVSAAISINPTLVTISSIIDVYSNVSVHTYYTSTPLVTPANASKIITIQVSSLEKVRTVNSSLQHISKLSVEANVDSISKVSLIHKTKIQSIVPTITTTSSTERLLSMVGGVIDYLELGTNNNEFYSLGKLGNTVYNFIDNLNNDTGIANVSGYSIDILERHVDLGTIANYDLNLPRNNTSVTTTGQIINYGVPTLNEYGMFLDSALNTTDTTIYVANTDIFPPSGKLLVGSEVVYYAGKSFGVFTGVIRGYNNTTPQSHPAGQYLRTCS